MCHLVSSSLLVSKFGSIDSSRRLLEARGELWFRWLLFSGLAVALGCVLEIGETYKSIKEWRRERKEGPSNAGWAVPIAALGLFFVIIGVIGEGIFETLASRTDTELRQRFSDELAAAEIQAGQANERASKAQQDAAELRVVADQLEEHNLDTGPRQLLLYGKRMDNFLSAIQTFKDQKVEIRKCQFNSKEIADTADRLTTLFERAKWNVSPHSPQWGESNCLFPDPLAAFGIWVGTPNPDSKAITRERAQQLVKLLNRIPLTASMHSVRVETVRAESGRSELETYDDPDAIVVVVLSHN